MARNSGATRFASVNLNQSYGKQPQTASPAVGGSGTRSRLPGTTHGGMLLLTRPTRPQPAGLKNPKLTVPRPVNLPSLRREHAGNDPTVSLVGGSGTSGWIKQQQISEDLLVDSVSASHGVFVDSSVAGKGAGSSWGLSQQSATLDGELRPRPQQTAGGRSGVYTPPGARVPQADVFPHPPIVVPSVVAVEKAVLLRGEDFPTLQASLAPVPASAPAPPPHDRQKELQQRQRDKQRELKEQQKKLHQLTQKHQDEEAEKIQQLMTPPQPVVSLQPQSKHDQVKKVHEGKFSEAMGHGGKHPIREEGRSLPSGPASLIRLNRTSNWADDERDNSINFKSKEDTIKPQEAAFLDWIDRESEPLVSRRPFQRETPPTFGRNADIRRSPISYVADNPSWDRDHVKEGISRDTHRKDYMKDNALGVEGSFGRDLAYGRERTFGRDSRYSKISDFGIDRGSSTRDDAFDKAHTISSNVEAARGGRSGLDRVLPTREMGGNREMSFNQEDSSGENGPQRKGMGNHDRGSYGVMNGYTKSGSIDRENYRGGLGIKGRDSRESFGGMNGQNKDPRSDPRGEREGLFRRDGLNVGRSAYDREARDGSFGRDGFFSKSTENGNFDGEKTFNRFRNGRGREAFQEFGMSKAGRSDFASDNGRGRTGNSMLHSTDPYTRAFAEFVRVDYRSTSVLGLEMFESKALRRKKDVKESNFRDLERESFEAELERVQKLLEDDRRRKIEEQERAIEMARKEQEERERLAKEEEERQLRLEEEAREAAAKAEREALEAVHKAEEIRRAREEEKKQILLEEEARKENARRKLLELEERIAKREADKKRKEEEEMGQLHRGGGYNAANNVREDAMGNLEDDARERIFSMDREDDDRAPLRPSSSERPLPKFKLLHSGPSFIKSPEELNQQVGGYDVTHQSGDMGSGSLGLDVARASSFWKKGPFENDVDSVLTSKRLPYPPADVNNPRFSLSRDHSYHVRRFDDWEQSPFGSSYSYSANSPGDRVSTEKLARKDQLEGSYNWRQGVNDGVEPQMKYENGHLRYSDVEQGSAENSFSNRGSDRRGYNDKLYRSWEGRPSSPLSPPPYYHGADSVEGSASGRLRQFLPKQPRVPPPPLQTYKKPLSKSVGDHLADDSNLVHHETKVYIEQEMRSKEHIDLKNTRVVDLDFQSLPTKLQEAKQSSSSESEFNLPPAENSQQFLAHQSELSSSPVAHPGTLSLEIEPVSKPLVESHNVRLEEEDSGEEGDEEMLEDSEAAEYAEEEVSYEERGDFEEEEEEEEEEENHDDVEEEKVVSYKEDICDEVEESFDAELSTEKVHSKTDKVCTGISELTVDSFEVIEGDNNTVLVLDEEPLKLSAVKEQIQYASASDLQSHNLMGQEMPLDCTAAIDQQVEESSEILVQPKYLQERMTSSSAFQSVGTINSHTSSSAFQSVGPIYSTESAIFGNGISFVQQQHLDNPMMMPSATPLPVTSSYTPLSVVQNHLEVPMTLQFGLLPSTSLLPASVPAIQIGSIQMPLPVHMHSHLSPHVTHLHPSHASPFQFGQLGHPIALSQLLPSFSSQAQPVGRASMQNENMEQQSVTIPPVSSVHETSAAFDEPVYLSSEVVVPEPVRFIQAASLETLNRVEDENFEKEASEPAPQNASNMEEQNLVLSGNKQENNSSDNDFTKNISQYVALFDANAESTAEVHQIPRRNFEHRKNEGGSWQQSHLQSSTSNLPLRSELGVREGEKAKDWHFSSEFSGNHEMRHEGTTYHGRSNRRNHSRGSEFRVKEALVVNDGSAGGPRQSSKARCLNSYSTSYSRNRGTHDKVFQKDGFKGQVTYERKSGKESGHTPSSVGIDYFWNSGGKTEKANEESVQKNLARGRSGDGLLGKFGSMEDVPLQSGIVHVFEQPGIEVPGDEDDFIEVRSKRQMLNDRREQREKEIKAKSKAKEQVGRKLKFSAKQATQGDSVGPKHPGSAVSERKNLQGAKADAAGSSGARLVHSGTPTETLPVATSVATSSSSSSLPAITSNISETVLDKKSKLTNSTKTTLGAGLPISDGDVSSSPILDTLAQDNVTTSTHAWGVSRSSQQVVSLTQIQLEEVLKPVRYDLPLQPQLSLGEHGIIGIEAGSSNNSLVAKERISASMTDSTIPPLNGEEIQFGAVTSTYVSPISRPNTPSILGAVGSSVAFRSDTFTDSNELRKKLKQLPGTEDDVTAFGTKGDRSREDGRRNGGTFDSEAEAEAEAAASAVAVAAISNDDSVKGLKYGSSQSNSVSGILNSASLNHANLGGHVSSSSSSGVMLGGSSTRPVIVPAPVLEDIKAMALPADLSVETHSFSLGGNSHSGQGSSGLLLPSLPSAFPGLDLGPMIGGHMFAFGAGSDVPNGLQGTASGAVHEQGAANLGLNIAGWQQHVGSSDSFYGAPHGFAGPFMSPAGAVPNLQAPHHMLVYTNPFAPIGQFGQLGVSFMGATYIQSGKQPDWTHTPVTSSCPGLVSMSVGEGLGGVLASQRNISGVASPIQRLAPGPSVVPVTPPSGPFDLSREATFQIPTVEVPMQPPWSHVSVPHLQSMPTTGPLLGYSMQSRHPHGSFIPTGHLQHAADANMHIVHSPNIVSGSSFQSVDASVQFPDELGLGDSISTTLNPVNSYVGQQLSSKGAVGSAVSTGTSAAAEINKLQRGRRPRMARGGGMQGTGEGTIGSHAGFGTSPGNAIGQPANIGRSSPGHLHPEEQVSLLSPGQHMHHVGFVDQKATSQLLRAGATGSWSGQGSRKVGMPARPQATDRGISSEKSFVSSTKLKQVYVVKPSAAYKRMGPNSGESAANMFVHDVGQTGIDG